MAKDINQDAETVNFVLIVGEIIGIITLADTIREGSQQAINDLIEMHIKSFLLSGENEKIAAAASNKLRMDGFLPIFYPIISKRKLKNFKQKEKL
ncbi:hypothetical protein [Litoribacter populi]|uniref:hypothetical protein n=1 Tax=Litoribacter populi TaxID=2598460 RepID=UPI0037435E28